jgi:hypothetical protein
MAIFGMAPRLSAGLSSARRLRGGAAAPQPRTSSVKAAGALGENPGCSSEHQMWSRLPKRQPDNHHTTRRNPRSGVLGCADSTTICVYLVCSACVCVSPFLLRAANARDRRSHANSARLAAIGALADIEVLDDLVSAGVPGGNQDRVILIEKIGPDPATRQAIWPDHPGRLHMECGHFPCRHSHKWRESRGCRKRCLDSRLRENDEVWTERDLIAGRL